MGDDRLCCSVSSCILRTSNNISGVAFSWCGQVRGLACIVASSFVAIATAATLVPQVEEELSAVALAVTMAQVVVSSRAQLVLASAEVPPLATVAARLAAARLAAAEEVEVEAKPSASLALMD